MKIHLNLRQVLREYGLDEYGIINTLAAAMCVNRDTASKLYNGKATSIIFSHLGRLCAWLAKNKVPRDRLPAILFEQQMATLWEALERHKKKITIYLGEYQSMLEDRVTGRWISRADSEVAANLIKTLSQDRSASALSTLELMYVPFHYSPHDPHVDKANLEKDIKANARIFDCMKHSEEPGSSIIVGSQRVNYQLELFLADLFGCHPFPLAPDKRPVPLFTVYRKMDQNTPSCFGGRKNPYASSRQNQPGIHYMRDKTHWSVCPWIEGQQDAAVVISVNNHEKQSITLAVFGYTGRATEAVGEQLMISPDRFWPPKIKVKQRDVGVYLYVEQRTPAQGQAPATRTSHIIDMKEAVIKAFVK